MSVTNGQQRVTKTFPVFDCDAHINDPDEIWTEYVEPEYREVVRRSYWKDAHQAVLNGRTPVIGGAAYDFPGYNPICLAGPQMTKKIARKLQQIGLTSEQKKYVEHPGAYDPRARLKEMDLMGIDQVFRKFEETGIVLGMHTFPAINPEIGAEFRKPIPGVPMTSPGELVGRAGEMHLGGRMVDVQTLSFIFEAVVWLAQVLLSGMLDLYPKLRMAIFESNSTWLPELLDYWDRLFKLYANERNLKTDRLPSEAFYQQCYIAFESDETPTFRQWDRFEDVGVWSSDAYHHDGADSWSAIREMRAAGVPEDVQAKLLGGNARRMYGIEAKLCVAEEPPPLERPAWFPQGEELERWAEAEADPRAHGITKFDLAKLDPRLLMQALRPY